MSDYREVARTARSYVLKGQSPPEAWKEAATRAFKNSASRAKNAAPRNTFLGLCAAGLVKGIEPGDYVERGGDAQKYAVRMIELLREDDDYEDEPEFLFSDATEGKILKETGQLDVVFGLWNHGLIVDE